MKKIFLSILTTIVLSSLTVFADGGKKTANKSSVKKANSKKVKKYCPNRSGCICN